MRCRLLAEKLFGVFTESPLLKEMNFGKWEGLSWNAIYADQQGRDWMNNYLTAACPAGESFQTFCQRITRFTDQLLDTNNSRTAIVTHAGVMRVMQAYLENKPLDRYLSRTIAFGEILPLTTE
jgi:alpha-ribazole phosphatase